MSSMLHCRGRVSGGLPSVQETGFDLEDGWWVCRECGEGVAQEVLRVLRM